MRNLLKPKWLFIVNTLPIVLLFFIFYHEFQIIKTLLEDESILLWKIFGWSLASFGILNFGYGFFLTIKKKKTAIFYGAIALLVYIPFIYLYSYYSAKIIPSSIPQWMTTGNISLYVGTFLMPTLIYSLFILVLHFTPENKEHKAWKSFLITISIPIIWYLLFQIILPLWKPVERNFNIHVMLVFIIIGTLIFLFFLVRAVLIILTKKSETWQKYQIAWKIPITIILPIVGLLIINGILFKEQYFGKLFGDFKNIWFYVLAIINGLFICLPNLNHKEYRLVLFLGRSVTFAYTFYLFLVFLPFLPLSVIAIIAFGFGFLMLTPILIFILHINELSKDFNYLKHQFSNKIILVLSLVSFLILPFCININFIKHKSTLNEALEYVYSPDYSKKYEIDKSSLKKTLGIIKNNKKRNKNQQPYLSIYFKWLVLDDLTLSYNKINDIESIFFGKPYYVSRSSNNLRKSYNIDITNISTRSEYDTSQNAWKSWVDLEITNNNNSRFSEYRTTINLPEGTWISDYYLNIGDRKEMGILAEKKSAMWVFSNIRNENKDPGILYYLTGNKVAFKVFPFAKNEVRKTGIEFLHKEPIQLNFDGNIVQLGKNRDVKNSIYENQYALYIPTSEKEKLEEVYREPYFHFILDISNKDSIPNYTKSIDKVIKKYPNLIEKAKISFVNTYVTTTTFDNWKQKFKNQPIDSSFNVDLGIKSVLFNSYKEKTNTYPVIVIVTDNLYKTTLHKDYSDWKFTFPETDLFYTLYKEGNLKSHSLISNPLHSNAYLPKSLPLNLKNPVLLKHSVLKYKLKDNSIQYLPNDKQPSIILKKDVFETNISEIKEKNWDTALTIHGKNISKILHPNSSNKEWLEMVKYSFISKIMTPVTSYLVVENEAQKAILKKKQELVLTGNKVLDLDEDTRRMSEPSLLVIILLLALVFWARKKKNQQKQSL